LHSGSSTSDVPSLFIHHQLLRSFTKPTAVMQAFAFFHINLSACALHFKSLSPGTPMIFLAGMQTPARL